MLSFRSRPGANSRIWKRALASNLKCGRGACRRTPLRQPPADRVQPHSIRLTSSSIIRCERSLVIKADPALRGHRTPNEPGVHPPRFVHTMRPSQHWSRLLPAVAYPRSTKARRGMTPRCEEHVAWIRKGLASVHPVSYDLQHSFPSGRVPSISIVTPIDNQYTPKAFPRILGHPDRWSALNGTGRRHSARIGHGRSRN